ncbi:MAG: glycosyltransferase [Bacteroidota bacterium]
MIAFVQPFGLMAAGGGPRILRALLLDRAPPSPCLSVCTKPRAPRHAVVNQHVSEVHLPRRPAFGRLDHSRLAGSISHLDQWLAHRFRRRLLDLCRTRRVQAIHAIPHGLEFWHAFQVAREMGIPYILNVHDDLPYNIGDRPYLDEAMGALERVWRQSDERVVISGAMGEEYNRRYGEQPYTVITDGLAGPLPDQPRPQPEASLRVYFMGALHLTYHPNFQVLVQALERIQDLHPEWTVSLASRGSKLPVKQSHVPLVDLPFAPEDEVRRDAERFDMLYLPLPFGDEYASFTRFSLSTKLVTYLGMGLPILYHGPDEAAASQLLAEGQAAAQVHALDVDAMVTALLDAKAHASGLAQRGIELGKRHFQQDDQHRRFWTLMTSTAGVVS